MTDISALWEMMFIVTKGILLFPAACCWWTLPLREQKEYPWPHPMSNPLKSEARSKQHFYEFFREFMEGAYHKKATQGFSTNCFCTKANFELRFEVCLCFCQAHW